MKLIEKLKQVQTEKKALLAANYYNLETCQAIVRAASKLQQPIILQLTPASIKYMGLKTAVSIARTISQQENITTWLHLDHSNEIELIKNCLDEGFDSIMIDASDKTFEENILITKKVVDLAKTYGVNVEAELGYVSKPESDVETDKFTKPEDVTKFVKETGVTSLAIAIGSKHGFYKEKPNLDIERLKQIRNLTDVFLVLHGASGIPTDMLQDAIRAGITKVNIATETKDQFMKSLKEILKNSNEIDLRKVFPLAVKDVQNLIEEKIKVISMLV
ncbi:MAG: class II fructose-bisphosphate aldolase [Ignavibacterium sp.]|uniref:class II fructose-bisphosphate aldolase n=1 Tax=Ignavibacterium sp. TaxID=2651167 RepID=UPI00404A9375